MAAPVVPAVAAPAPAPGAPQTYWQELPRDAGPVACQSFLYSFTMGVCLSGFRSVSLGLFNGAAALVCSVVDTLTRPIFNRIFPEQGSWGHFFVRVIVVLAIVGVGASGIAGACGSAMAVNVIVSWMVTQFVNSLFGTGDEGVAEPFFVV